MILPRRPGGPVRPDEDPTGVRALLSSLPEPGPMPQDLVARISASLAAEEANHTPAHPRMVAPLVRRGGAAAAVAAVAALGTAGFDLLQRGGSTTSAGSAAAQLATGATGSAGSGNAGSQAGPARTPSIAPRIRLQLTSTQYTAAGFAAQARALPPPSQPSTPLAAPSGAGAVATTRGLLECLKALGEGDADAVSADIAYYEGQPAAVILTWHGTATTAYAVRRDCSRDAVAVLHPATPLQ